MHTLALLLTLIIPTPTTAAADLEAPCGVQYSADMPGGACEEFGPRRDGTYVTVCAGEVVSVRDSLGNVRTTEVR